jgi:hypothetical protein
MFIQKFKPDCIKNYRTEFILSSVLFFVILIFESCIKEPEHSTQIEGVVFDEGDGSPIPNATVKLLMNDGGGLNNLKVAMETTTDKAGSYSFSFDPHIGHTYYVSATKDKYMQRQDTYSVHTRHRNIICPKLNSTGIIKLHVKNVSPTYGHEYISISALIQTEILNDFYGPNVDTILFLTAHGKKSNDLPYWIHKNSVEKTGILKVFANADDTTSAEILY